MPSAARPKKSLRSLVLQLAELRAPPHLALSPHQHVVSQHQRGRVGVERPNGGAAVTVADGILVLVALRLHEPQLHGASHAVVPLHVGHLVEHVASRVASV